LFVFKITCKILLAKEPIFKIVKERLVLCSKREMKAHQRGNQVVQSKNCSLYFFELQCPVGIEGRQVFWKTIFTKLKKSALLCGLGNSHRAFYLPSRIFLHVTLAVTATNFKAEKCLHSLRLTHTAISLIIKCQKISGS